MSSAASFQSITLLIQLLAAMGATFSLTKSVAANQRHTDDHINGAVGGCAAGFLAGVRGQSSSSTSRPLFTDLAHQHIHYLSQLAVARFLAQ